MEGNVYVKTEWRDHIVSPESGEVIQQGTRFTAQRANNIEEGIAESFSLINQTGVQAYQQMNLVNNDLLELTFQLRIENLVSDDSMKTVYVDAAAELILNKGVLNGSQGKVYI